MGTGYRPWIRTLVTDTEYKLALLGSSSLITEMLDSDTGSRPWIQTLITGPSHRHWLHWTWTMDTALNWRTGEAVRRWIQALIMDTRHRH